MINIIKTRESRRAFQVMPVNRIKLRLKKSSDLQEMTPLDAGSRLHDAGHKGVLGKRSSDQVMELTPTNSIPGIFFGKGSTTQISSPEHDPKIDICVKISESVHVVGERPDSDDNDCDIVSKLADEFMILFDEHLQRAPFAAQITMTKQTAMYQGATTLRTSILAMRKFNENN